MRVLLIGATGVVGRRAAAELARSEEIETLFVAARTMDVVGRLAGSIGGSAGKVRPLVLDATDYESLVPAFKEMDVVASCAGPAYLTEETSVAAALAAAVPYVSTCDDHPVTEAVMGLLGIEEAVAPVVSGCAMSPGISNMLVAKAASELDDVRGIEIAVAASSNDPSGPASELHLLAAFSGEAPMVAEGELVTERASTDPMRIYFPEPVGWTETFWCGHPEVLTMKTRYPNATRISFRLGLTEKAAMDTVRAAVAAGLVGTERKRRAWLRLSAPVRPLIERIPPLGAPWTAVRVDVTGTRSKSPAHITFGVVDHLSNLAAIPLAHATEALGAGRAAGRGLTAPEDALEITPFLHRLSRRGIRIARLEPHAL
jgi:saccharopine dehydrogenase-like NADP-dependent oxidoreductase